MRRIGASTIWKWTFLLMFLLFISTEIYVVTSMEDEGELSSLENGWAGASAFSDELSRRGFDVRSLLTTPSLLHEEEDPGNTLLISLGPQREYSLSELHALRKFHSRGGRILMADDSGNGNGLASRFEVNFVRGQLYDQNFVSSPDLVKFDVNQDFFDGTVLMNRPASLSFSSGQALIASTTSAWVDRNGNGINDNISTNQGEAPGIRYLAVISDPDFTEHGSGAAVFIADPSLFMNGMIELEGNMEFAVSLVEHLLPRGGKVIFDDSVHRSPDASGIVQRSLRGLAFATTDVNLKIVSGAMAVLALLSAAYLYEPPGKPGHDCILNRTGVAELVEPELLEGDLAELRKAVLDRIRVSYGMSVDDFSALSWNELEELVGSPGIYRFLRKGKYRGGVEELLLEVMAWERK